MLNLFRSRSTILGVVILAASVIVFSRWGSGPPNTSPYVDAAPPTDLSVPILILVDDASPNPFGRYLGEILRAEGINGFRVARWPEIARLGEFDTILLAEQSVDDERAERLRAFVEAGGLLIGMRPDPDLAPLFGVERSDGSVAEGSIRIDNRTGSGRGLDGGLLRIHGVADHYRAASTGVVARLFEQCGSVGGHPAIVLHHHGRGRTILWAYDLARSVAYARQGNPAWADIERDGLEGIRASDMFVGWIDQARLRVPEADEQQLLLAKFISASRRRAAPVPRLWYFPGDANAVLVATGDAHSTPAYAIEDVLDRVEKHHGHMTVYYEPPRSNILRRTLRRIRWWAADLPLIGSFFANPTGFASPQQVSEWRARGHEIALHPLGNTSSDLDSEWRRFTSLGYGPVSPTMRTHRALWRGWADMARDQAAAGIRMNLDYYQVGPAFEAAPGEWPVGFFTGSGLPMRFVDENGRILDIYQQTTQLVDEHWIDLGWTAHANLEPDEAVAVSKRLLQNAVEHTPAAIAVQFHADPFVHPGEHQERAARWMEGTLDAAVELGIPILSAAEWLRFTEVRHDAELRDFAWDESTGHLSFRLESTPTTGVDLTVLFPARTGRARLTSVEVDGVDVPTRRKSVAAVTYDWVSIPSGSRKLVATYARSTRESPRPRAR